MKKFIALLISLTMLCTCSVSFIPAFAAEDVVTDYGTIPAQYADVSAYPIAIFNSDKTFKTAKSIFADNTGNCAMYFIRSDYSHNSGKYILLRDDVSTGGYSNLNYHFNQAGIIDLGGHTLTVTSTYLLSVAQRFAKNVNLTFKNGTIVYPDKIISYSDNASWSGTAQFNFTFDNITFKLSEGSKSTSILTNGIKGTETVTSTITLNNCIFDLTDKDDSVTTIVFDVGSSTVTNNITVVGGKFITDSEVVPYRINNENSSISFDADENGNYIKVAVPASVNLSSLTLPSGKNTIAYNGPTETYGDYVVYVGAMVKEDIETAYGTIPGEYASTTDYPVVVFKKDKSFFKTARVFADGTASCGMYWLRSDNSGNQGMYLLLREDATMANYSNINYHYNQANIIDLGGNTLTVSSESMLSVIQRFAKDVNITFRNGTIVYSDKIIAYGDDASWTGSAGFNFTFENITFRLSANAASANAVVSGNAGSDAISGDLMFDNCTFDLAAKDTSANTTVFNLALPAVANKITVKGGNLITNDSDTVVFNRADGESAIIFVADDNGKYFSLTYPVGSDILNAEFPTENGTMYATIATSDATYDYFELSSEPYVDLRVKTEYGIIPSEYADASMYPVAVFKNDGTFLKGVTAFADTTVNCGMYWIRSDYNSNQGKYLLLRSDAQMSYYPNANHHYSQENIIDLGGNTLTVTSEFMLRLYNRFDKNVSMVFKNGTIAYSDKILDHSDSESHSGNGVFNITFENITFRLSDASTSASMITDALAGNDTVTDNITLKNCTFDLTGKDASVLTTIFDAGSETVTSTIVVQGGQIIANNCDNLKIANANSDASSVTFTADDNGKYTSLRLPVSAEITKELVSTTDGDAAYAISSKDDEFVIYELSGDFVAKPGIIGDNVTIYAINIDKDYKLYAASYAGNELSDCKIVDVSDDMRITVSDTQLATSGCDTMKVFLWDGVKPICPSSNAVIK